MATTTVLSPFQKALDVIEALPDTQQEHLLEVVQHRLIEARQQQLARSIREAKADYRVGRTKKGSCSDLMKELRSCAS